MRRQSLATTLRPLRHEASEGFSARETFVIPITKNQHVNSVTKSDITPAAYAGLHRAIAEVVASTRAAAARSVNAMMTASCWEIGQRIVEFEQGGEGRAAYGEALIRRLGTDLSRRFGRGFGWRNLAQMRAFYLAWPVNQILQTLSAKSPPSSTRPSLSAFTDGQPASCGNVKAVLELGTVAHGKRSGTRQTATHAGCRKSVSDYPRGSARRPGIRRAIKWIRGTARVCAPTVTRLPYRIAELVRAILSLNLSESADDTPRSTIALDVKSH